MVAFILFIVLAVMWVLLAVPRQREARRHNAVVSSLARGDEIMTGGGIYGTVVDVSDEHILLEVAPATIMKVARRAVATRVEADIDLTADRPVASDGIWPVTSDGTRPVTSDGTRAVGFNSDSTVDATAPDHPED